MLKKIIIGSMVLIFIGSWSFFGYRLLEPKMATPVQEIYVNVSSELNLTSNTVNEYMLGHEGIEYYYFCKTDNADCDYVNENILKPLAKEVNLTSFDMIQYVNMTDFDDDTSQTKMRNLYGFQSYPAFVSAKTDKGTIEIISVLQWDKNLPFDGSDLKEWMINNAIWQGEVKADSVDTQ